MSIPPGDPDVPNEQTMKARLSRILTKLIGCAWAVYFLLEGVITPKHTSLMDRIALIVAATFVALLLFGIVCLVFGAPEWSDESRSLRRKENT